MLCYEPTDLFIDSDARLINIAFNNEPVVRNVSISFDTKSAESRPYKITDAGTSYVGLSLVVLFSQLNDVAAVDILPKKVEKAQ